MKKVQRPDLQAGGLRCQVGVLPEAKVFIITHPRFILGGQNLLPFALFQAIVSEIQIYTKCEKKKTCGHRWQKPVVLLEIWLIPWDMKR